MSPILLFLLFAFSLSFIGAILPISFPFGALVSPFGAHWFDPTSAITLTLFYAALGAIARVIVFFEFIEWRVAGEMIPGALIGALFGSYITKFIPEKFILIIIIGFCLYCVYRLWYKQENKGTTNGDYITGTGVGLLSGIATAIGIGGGSLRSAHLATLKDASLPLLHATGAVIFLATAIIAVTTRVASGQVAYSLLLPLGCAFVPLLLITYLGKKIIFKLNFSRLALDTLFSFCIILTALSLLPKLFS